MTTTNVNLQKLIQKLKTESIKNNQSIWKRIASDLEKPSRKRRVVNLSRINRFTQEGEIIVVPGKVLGSGDLNHKLTIAAWRFSDTAKDKISKNKSKAISIFQLMKSDIKGKKVRIIG
ncbi:MAG: 50S ribosomal protein L18e [Candidatus Woesearchaeota archaeon]|nr:50S ribosomal protein L18e [Candidatus Woesearchaeota archaeon]